MFISFIIVVVSAFVGAATVVLVVVALFVVAWVVVVSYLSLKKLILVIEFKIWF